jgi:hypothetical protein
VYFVQSISNNLKALSKNGTIEKGGKLSAGKIYNITIALNHSFFLSHAVKAIILLIFVQSFSFRFSTLIAVSFVRPTRPKRIDRKSSQRYRTSVTDI